MISFLKKLNFSSYILFLLLLIQLGFFIWALDKGFDFTDEAYGYLGFKNEEQVHKAHTYYTLIFNTFFGWVDLTVINVRIIRLLLVLVCGSVFALGLVRWLRRHATLNDTQEINLFLFVLSGSFLMNAHGGQSLTYNLASTYLLQLVVGGLLYSLQGENKIVRNQVIVSFLLGVLLFLLFAVKISTAIALFFAMVLLIFLDKKNFKGAGIHIASILGGGLIMGFIMFGTGFPEWLIDYKNTIALLVRIRSGSVDYAGAYAHVKTSVIVPNTLLIIATVVLLLLNRRFQHKILNIFIALLVAGLLTNVTYQNGYYYGGVQYYYYFTLFYLLIIFILLVSQLIFAVSDIVRKRNQKAELMIMVVFLFLIPFFGALGSTNLLFVQIIWYTSFIFAGLYLLLYSHGRYVLDLLIVLLGVNAALQAISGIVYFPYRTNPLHEEIYSITKVSPNEKVRVREEIKQSLERAHELIHAKTNFSKGDPIFSFASDFGFIYFLDGTLPGWAWYLETPTAWTSRKLRISELENPDRIIFILPVNFKMDSVYQSCFDELKIKFPENYVNLGQVPFHNENVDRPLEILAPKSIMKN